MIETTDSGNVRSLRLARPPANALNAELLAALRAALQAASSERVGGLVISGAPGMFSAGLDVPELLTLERSALAAAWRDFYGVMATLAAFPVPVAAAITGHSPAGGAVLALFCDHRVMAQGRFKIGLNEVQVGLPLPPTIYRALERLVGPRSAAELAAGGLLLGPAQAEQVGLVDRVVEPEEVEAQALAWCQARLALPPVAMLRTRELARRGLVELFADPNDGELEQLLEDWFSEETQRTLRQMVARLAAKK